MLTGSTALIVFVIALVVIVFFSQKLKLNMGILGLGFAFILGGCFNKMSPASIVGLFPTDMLFTQMIVTLFFGYAVQTNVFRGIVDRMIYISRGAAWALPFTIFITATVIGALGAGASATPVILSPLAFSMAASVGFNPLLAAMAVYLPSCWTGSLPWTAGGTMFRSIVANTFGETDAYTVMNMTCITIIICFVILFVLYYFIKKGNKIDKDKMLNLEKPVPFTSQQKTALKIVLAVILILLLPNVLNSLFPNKLCKFIATYFEIRTMSILGILTFHICKIGDPVDAIKNKVPWGVIIMVTGMCTFINVGVKMGIVNAVGTWIGDTIPGTWMPLALVTISAILSFVTTGPSVIYPMFMPMVPALAAAGGINPLILAAALVCGPMSTGLCPLSQGGAMSQLGASDEVRAKIFGPQVRAAFVDALIFMAFAAVGWFPLLGKLFKL